MQAGADVFSTHMHNARERELFCMFFKPNKSHIRTALASGDTIKRRHFNRMFKTFFKKGITLCTWKEIQLNYIITLLKYM